MSEQNMENTEQNYPSLDLAYPLATASYDAAQKRLEAVEKRLQEVLGFAVAITIGIVTLCASKSYNFKSCLFVAAMAACACGLAVSIYARTKGRLILINPSVLHEKYRALSEIEFKSHFLYFAGQHWHTNASMINRKGYFNNIAVACFLAEIILLAWWLVAGS